LTFYGQKQIRHPDDVCSTCYLSERETETERESTFNLFVVSSASYLLRPTFPLKLIKYVTRRTEVRTEGKDAKFSLRSKRLKASARHKENVR